MTEQNRDSTPGDPQEALELEKEKLGDLDVSREEASEVLGGARKCTEDFSGCV